jgi:hypothetical protein
MKKYFLSFIGVTILASTMVFAGTGNVSFRATEFQLRGNGTNSGKMSIYNKDSSHYATLTFGTTATGNRTFILPDGLGSNGQALTTDGVTQLGWSNLVSNVGLTMPSLFSVTGSPITGSGTFNVTLTGTLGIANGGTGAGTASDSLTALLPSQSGNNGKVLGTDGTVASWQSGSSTFPTIDVASFTDQGSTPTSPSSGTHKAYVKTSTGKLTLLNSSGVETTVGSGGTGTNFITNGDAEAGTTGWAVYADAAGTSPVDGTGGSANVTITTSATAPLSGANSFLLTKDAVNRQGQGWSYAFSIDTANQAKVLSISFDYLVNSGTFVAGNPSDRTSAGDSDVTVWIYDVTNAVVIQSSTYRLYSNSTTIADHFSATFQSASNSTSYRLIFHVGTTSASAYTLKADNVQVSPSQYVYGSPVTDPVAYTPTFTGFGTVSNVNFVSWREGAVLKIKGTFTSGTATATEARVTLGYGGFNGNVTSVSTLPTISLSGSNVVYSGASSAGNYSVQPLVEPSVTYLTFGIQGTGNVGLTKLNGSGLAGAGSVMSFFAEVPIVGWSSSVQMSDSASTSVISTRVAKSGSQTSLSNGDNKITSYSVVSDRTGMWDATNNRFNISTPGDYQLNHNVYVSGGTGQAIAAYRVNGVGSTYGPTITLASGDARTSLSTVIPNLKAGDYVELYFYAATGSGITINLGDGGTFATLNRITGPTSIAAMDTVSALYMGIPTGSIGAAWNAIAFPTKLKDSHNLYSSGSYTVPASGTYSIVAQVDITATFTTGQAAGIGIYVDNVEKVTKFDYTGGSVAGINPLVSVNSLPLLAGQVVTIKTYTNGGGSPAYAGAAQGQFSITRTGNY